MNLNLIILVGRVTADPKYTEFENGNRVASFSIATNRVYKDKSGQKQEQAEFHNIVFWGKSAEIVHSYVQKGSEILVQGRIVTREWEDKQGQKRRTTEVVGERLQLGARPANKAQAQKPAQRSTENLPDPDDEFAVEDIPT